MPPVVLTVLADLPVPAVTGLQLRLSALLHVLKALNTRSHAIYFEHEEQRGDPTELSSLCESVVLGGRTRPYATFSVRERIAHRGSFAANATLRRMGNAYPFSITFDAVGAGEAVATAAGRVGADFVVLPSFLGHYGPALRRGGHRLIADAIDVQAIQTWNFVTTYGRRNPLRVPGLLANHLAARSQDRLALPLCDEIWANSDAQAQELRRLSPTSNVVVIANVLDEEGITRSPLPDGSVVGFIGNYRYTPNLDAATHLVEEILPRLRRRVPAAQLAIAGGGLPKEAEHRWASMPGVRILGRVPDSGEFMQSCRVLAFPLYFESGPPLKVVEALAYERPVVGSAQVGAALGLKDGDDALIGRNAEEAAARISDLLTDRALAESIAARGRDTFEDRFSLRSAVTEARRRSVLSPDSER